VSTQCAAHEHRRRWRDYRTAGGNRPVRDFLHALNPTDARAILAEMEVVRRRGLAAARHLRGDIWEVRVASSGNAYRILFAAEGRFSQILLALEAFQKTTQRTPPATIELAERRLADWRQRGRERED
jgi:phage-related protein